MEIGIGTKSQQALKLQQEQNKQERNANVALSRYASGLKKQYRFEGKNMEMKDRTGLKTIVAFVFLLLFFFVQGAIVVITKMEGVQSAIVRGTVIWSLVVITLVYFIIRYGEISMLGFRKVKKGTAKKVLYYTPLLLIAFLPLAAGVDLEEGAAFLFANLFLTLGIGMAEEIYFRGIICNLWLKQGVVKAMLLSSVLFGMSHILNVAGGADFLATILQICFAFVYGMVFTLIFIEGNSLIPCVLMHALHDFCSFISAEGSMQSDMILGAVQFVILLAYFLYMLYQRRWEEKER